MPLNRSLPFPLPIPRAQYRTLQVEERFNGCILKPQQASCYLQVASSKCAFLISAGLTFPYAGTTLPDYISKFQLEEYYATFKSAFC